MEKKLIMSPRKLKDWESTKHKKGDPLHGTTLETILNSLKVHYGWKELGVLVKIKCFNNEPSIKSSLNFLRRTPWARKKVEKLYLTSLNKEK